MSLCLIQKVKVFLIMRLSFLNPLNIGKPPKKCQKTSHIVRNMGGQQIFCVNLKKVVIFSYLEQKKTHVFG